MRKRKMLILAALIVCLPLLLQASASAGGGGGGPTFCTPPKGCTPGYWKQPNHFDSWVGYSPGDDFNVVFGVGPHITLGEALRLKGGGENRFMAHAVAALLNAAHPDICYAGWDGNEPFILYFVRETYKDPVYMFEDKKDILAAFNEAGCPLD